MAADLHIHTVYSDGLDSPAEVVEQARARGLSAISITDHDCVDGIGEAMAAAEEGLLVVSGVEINAEEEGKEFHILGYGFAPEGGSLAMLTAWLRERRLERMEGFIRRLARHGMPLDREEVLAAAGVGSVGRPHIAKALVGRGYVRSVQEAFKRFLTAGRPTYVPRERVPPVRAIEIVKEVGGVPILAHPLYGGNLDDLERIVAMGVAGIEVGHPQHAVGDSELLRGFAEERGLLTTGGSDYHGGMMEEGVGVGEVRCSEQELKALLERVGHL